MRFVVASFLVLSNFCALSAEPLTPMLTQRYQLKRNPVILKHSLHERNSWRIRLGEVAE